MSSYLNNLLTTTTSKYNTLRRTLLSDEADGDTEDDTHLCRVFRAYYQEKGRPYPQWLPPDPKAPQAAPAQFVSSQSGRQPNQPQMGRGGGGLNDLWDPPQQIQQQQEPASLRRAQGRGGGGRQLGRPGQDTYSPEPQAQGRPLPSQRGGSYQSASSFGGRPAEPSPPPSAGSGTTAQERLKARLWGSGRSNSPAQSSGSSANTSPAVTPGVSATRNPYDRAPAGRAPYPDDRNSGYSTGGGGGGGGRQQSQPSSYAMSANSPWAGNDDPYGPSYNTGGYQEEKPKRPGGGRVGLPSGPRMR
ncbi:hypothetical protein K505DRAFT_326940 [Melanomma pulvis-pyrius CBS 109.77]|uniref:Mso1 N-terminal domain-containing protein n=1 Tax=Melanomma pulvis-pyrius CBS 109.77 TaxID=1314802 RepID=A0A6A6X528_9PLEO|nr:hypothetical protein K505DRAFT_326940 [Melanomma pulvis-pyrius CBS 109.77]